MKGELAPLLKALAFAAHKHRDQRRKDPAASPYMNHPIALADVLVNEGGVADVEVLCAALLHDTVEDTATTPQEWDLAQRREYFDWAKRVVDGLRGAHPQLEAAFDAAYGMRK
jgi:guanosine-3',5'-bis(diphosphate) 3'-pyrophosphohydrolase